ncbi:MAG: helix-turn-helix domain-containing protein [bacterium]
MKNILGQRLRMLRNERGMGLENAASKLGVTKNTLSRYERGKRNPDHRFIYNAADFYGVTADYLLGRTDIRFNPNEKIKRAIEEEPELYAFWDELSDRDDLQLLFKQTRNLSSDAIKSVVRFIKAIEDEHKK